ncbi:hypothetical protein RI685_16705 (plasmid) [Clavibacter michiganensis]|uniref:hypothetical protein n=1 Tax=Clavibacter michiganensis TaxID=28447 RepID=UPI003DA17D49
MKNEKTCGDNDDANDEHQPSRATAVPVVSSHVDVVRERLRRMAWSGMMIHVGSFPISFELANIMSTNENLGLQPEVFGVICNNTIF